MRAKHGRLVFQNEYEVGLLRMWIFRRMLKVSYLEFNTNEEVMKLEKMKKELEINIKIRKARYFRHLIREKFQRDLMEGMVEGTSMRGQPRRMWTTDINEWIAKTYAEAKRAAQDRWHYRR